MTTLSGAFQQLLGADFDALPEAVRKLHTLEAERFFAGRANVTVLRSPLTAALIWAFSLPSPGKNVEAHVRCALLPDGRELWRRDFAGRRYESILESGSDGRLVEHLGAFDLYFNLDATADGLRWSMSEWRLFGLPLPKFLTPTVRSFETVDGDGRFTFRIEVTAPFLGRIIDYGGVLEERPGDAPVCVYDGVCILCDGSVRYALEHERTPAMRFVAIQSAEGRRLARENGVDPDDPDSFLFIEKGRALQKFDALFALSTQLRGPVRMLMLARFLPRFARDFLYDRIARNRYDWFGQKAACELPDATLRHRFVLPTPDGGDE